MQARGRAASILEAHVVDAFAQARHHPETWSTDKKAARSNFVSRGKANEVWKGRSWPSAATRSAINTKRTRNICPSYPTVKAEEAKKNIRERQYAPRRRSSGAQPPVGSHRIPAPLSVALRERLLRPDARTASTRPLEAVTAGGGGGVAAAVLRLPPGTASPSSVLALHAVLQVFRHLVLAAIDVTTRVTVAVAGATLVFGLRPPPGSGPRGRLLVSAFRARAPASAAGTASAAGRGRAAVGRRAS